MNHINIGEDNAQKLLLKRTNLKFGLFFTLFGGFIISIIDSIFCSIIS